MIQRNIPDLILVYFSQCPNVNRARDAIAKAGIIDFSEVNQDALPADHPDKQFSSPTIIFDGEIVVGSKNGAMSCSLIQWDKVTSKIIRQLNLRNLKI